MSRVLPARGKAAPRRAAPRGEAASTGSRPGLAASLARTARPKQWLKNVLVFTAPGAAGVLTHAAPLERTLAAVGIFCLVASGTYFLNDAADAAADRGHPTKSLRPIASGAISRTTGTAIGVVALAVGIGLSFLVSWKLAVVIGIYVAVQFGYSFYLKNQPVLDLAAVASGFVLRAIAGGVAAKVPVSEWFLIVATFGSMLMVTGKRLGEHIELGETAGTHRSTLDAYSVTFLRSV
ncbi:MAG: decaprenyl-phosphate phosphoribosyltransferase, partial [Acidimicrobiales bacterium]